MSFANIFSPNVLRSVATSALNERLLRRSIFSSIEADPIIRENRSVLSAIPSWIDIDAFSSSVFKYGIPDSTRPLIDLPINNERTYADELCLLSGRLTKPVNYLELGVSVGKNFLQMARHLRGACLTAFELEHINPILEREFCDRRVRSSWETMAKSPKKDKSTLTDYSVAGNAIAYLNGDIFDGESWGRIAGQRYNLIFSDAFHSTEAIHAEYRQLIDLDLIDREEFIMVWDDLGSNMTAAFLEIFADMASRFKINRSHVALNRYRGWVGQHEKRHLIGIISSRPL
jgi:hypothetical protein